MASTSSYSSLVSRATDSDDDPTLIYDITDKVKRDGSEGATTITIAIKKRFAFPSLDIKRRVLNLVDTLIIECGTEFHTALIEVGFLTTLSENHDESIINLILEHLEKWKTEMGPEFHPALHQVFPQARRSQSTSAIVNQPAAGGSADLAPVRAPGPLGQFKVKPVNPLVPFLTMPYVRAQRVLYLARDSKVFHMQSIHIARQALHLVILLNDLVDTDEGPDDAQEDERIDLEDELIELENAMKVWGVELISPEDFKQRIQEIKKQYTRFFKQRFYYPNARDPAHDQIFKKLLAYDKKTIAFRQWKADYGDTAMDVYQYTEEDDDDKSEAFIESVHTSPALSQSNIQLDKGKGKGREKATSVGEPALPSQVKVALAPGGPSQTTRGEEILAAAASPSNAGGIGSLSADDEIERARQFRSREAEEERGEQNFRCPVPGCGRTFEKQYLLKHHIREHDDRPYRCPMRGCDRRFATPMEQRVHEALHRIKNMGIVPNMPDFAPPIASTSTVPAPVPVAPPVVEPEETKSDGKPEGDTEGDGEDADVISRDYQSNLGEGQWEDMGEGAAFDEFMKPVIPGEGTSTQPTETQRENRMEEDTT